MYELQKQDSHTFLSGKLPCVQCTTPLQAFVAARSGEGWNCYCVLRKASFTHDRRAVGLLGEGGGDTLARCNLLICSM